jgi:hypothetical protein
MTYVLEYFVNKIGADIEKSFGLPRKTCWALLKGRPLGGRSGIAGTMASQARDWASRTDVLKEIQSETGLSMPKSEALLTRLVSDGLLSESAVLEGSSWRDVMVFPYQRFGDHLIARHLLEAHLDCSSEGAICRSFYANRPLGKIFRSNEWNTEFRQPGIAAAIMLEFPERMKRTRFRRELVGYLPKARRRPLPIKDVFLEGLYWRSGDSFTPYTDRLVEFFLEVDDDRVRGQTFEVLVTLATRYDHPYNAHHLSQRLATWSLAERDRGWSEYIRKSGELGALHRVLVWIENRRHGGLARAVIDNDVRLLALGLTTTDRTLRDRVTRALVEIGIDHPSALLDCASALLEFNDPYVPERMLAAAYGVAMRQWADPGGQELRTSIVPFARRLVRRMFVPDAPSGTQHALTQGYALGIIEICRLVAPRAIATRHLGYLRRPMKQLASPFRNASRIENAHVADASNAVHMDFENYTIGSLVPGRANYDMANVEYASVRKQILDRIRTLGYTTSRFAGPDSEIARQNWGPSTYGKVDRYGKKYSWIAYFEMYGVRQDRGELPEWRQEERPPDCDVDPSFPSEPRLWKPALPPVFTGAPTSPAAWLSSGPDPDYRSLLRRDSVDGQHGPWLLLDGYVAQIGAYDREVFTFMRSLLVDDRNAKRLADLVETETYLGNDKIPNPASDYYTYLGEIPWSRHFGADVRRTRGTARRHVDRAFLHHKDGEWSGVPVEIPVRHWAWESHHSQLTQLGSISFPSPSVCESLGLLNYNGSLDLRDGSGCRASVYREWSSGRREPFNSWLLYLREDLLQEYTEKTKQRLVWIPWGERGLKSDAFEQPLPEEVTTALREYKHIHRRLVWYEPA